MGFNLGHWLGQAAKSVGKPVQGAIHAVGQAGQAGLNVIGKVPVIGKPLADVYDLNLKPFEIAGQIAEGKNVSQTLRNGLTSDVQNVRGAAPLIQSTIALVPGVGPVASGMIGAGLAIAEGEPVDGVLEAGLASSVPGGALAASSYNLGKAVVEGKAKNPAQMVSAVLNSAAGAAGVQLPPGTAGLVAAGIGTTAALARGEKPDQALIQNAMPALGAAGPAVQGLVNQGDLEGAANKIMSVVPDSLKGLPKSVSDAVGQVKTGTAVGIAKQLQSSMKDALSSKMASMAIPAATLTPVELALMNSLPADERQGFTIGINVKNTKASQFQIAAVRQLLNNSREQDGYDAAISMAIGSKQSKPPSSLSPLGKAGFLVHQGISHSDAQHVANVVKILPPLAKQGAMISAQNMASGWLKIGGGAAVGGFAGFHLAGPLGAAIGAVAGGLLGQKL